MAARLTIGRKASGAATARVSISRPRLDEHSEAHEDEGCEDEQDDEQSLLHVLKSRLQDARSRYGFPYLRGRPACESSTFPSAFSIFSPSTLIESPRRYVPPA